MIVDITNEVYDKLKTTLGSNVTVLPFYPDSIPAFPCVTISESSIITYKATVDTSGEKHNDETFVINIFTNTETKMNDAKHFRDIIDGIMSGTYGMDRIFAGEVPNLPDTTIYRYVLRYSFIIDSNKRIYRR